MKAGGGALWLARCPLRMAGEESAAVAELVDQEGAEAEAHHAGSDAEVAAQAGVALSSVGEGNRDRGSHAHHADHGAGSEDQQVDGCPDRIVNGGEHEQSNGCGPGQSMDQADNERTDALIQTKALDRFLEEVFPACDLIKRHRRLGGDGWRETCGDLLHDACEIEQAEHDEHDRDAELHRQTGARRYLHAEEDDERAHNKDGHGMAKAPYGTDEGGVADASLLADDGGDGDDVVGVSRVPHAEHQAQTGDEEDRAELLFGEHVKVKMSGDEGLASYDQSKDGDEGRRGDRKPALCQGPIDLQMGHKAPGIYHRHAEDDQNGCEPEAEGNNEEEAKRNAVQSKGAEEDDQGCGAGNDAAGDSQGKELGETDRLGGGYGLLRLDCLPAGS